MNIVLFKVNSGSKQWEQLFIHLTARLDEEECKLCEAPISLTEVESDIDKIKEN